MEILREFWQLTRLWSPLRSGVVLLVAILAGSAWQFGWPGLLVFPLLFGIFTLLAFLLLPRAALHQSRSREEKLVDYMSARKQTDLHKFADELELSPSEAEHYLLHVLELEVFSFAYHRGTRRLYIYDQSRPLHHCPNCASDFLNRRHGKCPNCRVLFSRLVLRKPFYYL